MDAGDDDVCAAGGGDNPRGEFTSVGAAAIHVNVAADASGDDEDTIDDVDTYDEAGDVSRPGRTDADTVAATTARPGSARVVPPGASHATSAELGAALTSAAPPPKTHSVRRCHVIP